VLVARQLGLVTAVRPVLEHLQHSGMYLSDRLFKKTLALAGE
jgi:hypothetical protein